MDALSWGLPRDPQMIAAIVNECINQRRKLNAWSSEALSLMILHTVLVAYPPKAALGVCILHCTAYEKTDSEVFFLCHAINVIFSTTERCIISIAIEIQQFPPN